MGSRLLLGFAAVCVLSLACAPKHPPRQITAADVRPRAETLAPPPPTLDGPAGLPAVVIAELAAPDREIYFARDGARGLLVTRAKGKWLAGLVKADKPDDAVQTGDTSHGMRELWPAPEEGLVAVERGAGGFLVVWTEPSADGDRVVAASTSATGEMAGKPQVVVARATGTVIWLDVLPSPAGSFLLWETKLGSTGSALAVSRHDGKRWSEPAKIPGEAAGWHAVATRRGVAVARVSGDASGKGRVYLTEVVPAGAALTVEDLRVAGVETAMPDVQLCEVADRLLLAWTDTRDGDHHVFLATRAPGAPVETPRAALAPLGGQALIALVAAEDGGRALVAWERQHDEPVTVRRVGLAVLDAAGNRTGARGELAFHAQSDAPHIVPDGAGFAALTLAPMQLRTTQGEQQIPPLAPAYLRLDRELGVRAAEPIRVAPLKSDKAPQGVPLLAHGLSCAAGLCTMLAVGHGQPALLALVTLPARQAPWLAPVKRLPRHATPSGAALRAIADEPDPIADLSVTRLQDGRLLVAWVTHVIGGGPTAAPAGAKLRHRLVGADGSLGPIELLSQSAISIGGVDVEAIEPSGPKGRRAVAVIGWAGPDAGSSQVYATVIDEQGKKLRQKTVTKIQRPQKKRPIPNEVFDVDLVPDGKGNLLFAWSDTRDGDLEIYVARVNVQLQKNIPDQRVTAAKGPSTEATLLRLGDRTWIAWSDARDARHEADIYLAALDTATLKLAARPRRVSSTEAHSRTPRLARAGDGAVLGWIEEPKGDDQGHARLLALDAGGRELAAARRVQMGGGGNVSSMSLACKAGTCRGVVAGAGEAGLALAAFAAKLDGGAPITAKTVAELPGASAYDGALSAPDADGVAAYFIQDTRRRRRVRELRIDW